MSRKCQKHAKSCPITPNIVWHLLYLQERLPSYVQWPEIWKHKTKGPWHNENPALLHYKRSIIHVNLFENTQTQSVPGCIPKSSQQVLSGKDTNMQTGEDNLYDSWARQQQFIDWIFLYCMLHVSNHNSMGQNAWNTSVSFWSWCQHDLPVLKWLCSD